MKALYLGIDIGSASSKGVVVESSGRILGRAQVAHQMSLPRPGWVEMDAESVWWADVVKLCRQLAMSSRGRLAAVAVSGIGPCLLPVDAADRPLRPAILYGIDTRATDEVAELTDRYQAARILERGGSALSSQAVGPKLLWLRRHEPDVWAQTKRFYMAHSFIVRRLTGSYVLDHHSASQCDPLYDLGASTWARDWADEVAPGLEFPDLVWSDELAGHVTAAAARDTGIPEGTPVAAGTIDAWAEALSVGIREPGDTMVMYGTTMFIVSATRTIAPHPAMWGTAGVSAGTRTLAAGMATSGALTDWFRALVGQPSFRALLADARTAVPGSSGLVALPYFAGERTPIFDPDARGLIIGLTLRHGRGEVYRSLLESTAYGARHILEVMAEAGASPKRLVAVGGGTKGGLWTQIVSDVTGRPQDLPSETIGAALGDAMLAANAIGMTDPTEWNPVRTIVAPDVASMPTYDALYAIYRCLYEATAEQAHALAEMQRSARRPGPAAPSPAAG